MDQSDLLWPFFRHTSNRAAAYYLEPGPWVTAHVNGRVSWPTSNQIVTHNDTEFLLLPATDSWMAGIALNMRLSNIASIASARTTLSRFASALSWHEHESLSILDFTFDKHAPVHRNSRRLTAVTRYLFANLSRTSATQDARGLRALALYREGLSIENEFYAALSFFKVVENFLALGADRERWFKDNVERIKEKRARDRMEDLKKSHEDIGSYLYLQGRNAAAHAKNDDAVDPDDDQERFRFARDRPIYRAFAALAIREFAGLGDRYDRKPENKIAGFMEAQDARTLRWLRYQDGPEPEQLMVPSSAAVVVMNCGETIAIRNMRVSQVLARDSGLAMELTGPQRSGALSFHFDLKNRDLHFLGMDCRPLDSSCTRAMLDEIASVFRFSNLLWGNGAAWILDDEDGEVWGATGQVIPINMIYAPELAEPFVQKLGHLINERTCNGDFPC